VLKLLFAGSHRHTHLHYDVAFGIHRLSVIVMMAIARRANI